MQVADVTVFGELLFRVLKIGRPAVRPALGHRTLPAQKVTSPDDWKSWEALSLHTSPPSDDSARLNQRWFWAYAAYGTPHAVKRNRPQLTQR